MPLICSNCGSSNQEFDKVCSACGNPLPQPLEAPSPLSDAPNLPVIPASVPPPVPPPPPIVPPAPFAPLVFSSSVAVLCLASIAFVVLDDMSRKMHYLLPFAGFAFFAAVVGFWLASRFWFRIGVQGTQELLQLRRRLLVGLSIFAFLALVGGAILGEKVGTSGAETEEYRADIAQYRAVGNRVSAARNAAPNFVDALITMYQQIEPDVKALNAVVAKLIPENARYAARYPAAQATTTASGKAFDHTAQRGQLLLQLIGIAKQISQVPDRHERFLLYQEKMQPIVDEEKLLNKR